MEETLHRQWLLKRWVVETLLFIGLIPLICLVAIGHGSSIIEFPEFLEPMSNAIDTLVESDDGGFFHGFASAIATIIVPFFLFGLTALALVRTYNEVLYESGGTREKQIDNRAVSYLLPRNKEEWFWTTSLSLSAGVTEELKYRLFLPLLIFMMSGSALLAIVLSTIWFGLVHLYQGWIGILSTTLVGALLMFIYLHTRSLCLIMLIHAIIDLNELSIAPWFKSQLENRRIAR